ncbi:MAG: proteasome assembly chaperone family protein [Thermoplasmata archaeon]|nr:MAG: proteasome assembly chaperone family protein [Thermoplasmata archaeon]
MEEIKVYELKKVDLKGATVIDGFPSVGLVSSIVANYLINFLKLTQIGIMDSVYFPTVSLVREAEPLNPVRIYAGEKITSPDGESDQIVAFISEFQPPPNLVKPIAHTMLDWAEEQKCKLLISPEGLVIDKSAEDEADEPESTDSEGEEDTKEEETADENNSGIVDVYGIGSTIRARKMLQAQDVPLFTEGVITGVAGVLLNEGKSRDFDVISVMAEAHPDYPDARAAAKVIETIDKMLLHIHLDAKPLYIEAEKIEGQLKSIHAQAKPTKPRKPAYTPSIYR